MKKPKRIESRSALSSPSLSSSSHPSAPALPADPRPISFDVQPKPGQLKLGQPLVLGTIAPAQPSPLPLNDSSVSWQLASSRSDSEITLSLPRVATSGFTTHRNAANPALAVNLLKEIEALVSGWQGELQQILKQIQDIYLDGAIVDGWLESYSQEDPDSPGSAPRRSRLPDGLR